MNTQKYATPFASKKLQAHPRNVTKSDILAVTETMLYVTEGKFMKFQYYLTIAAFGGLTACGGGGGGDSDDTAGILTTNGVLTEVEVPSAADLAGLPSEIQDFVNAFVSANEELIQTTTRPPGGADYLGEYGFGFDAEDNPAVVIGDLSLRANFDLATLNGTVTNLRGDSEGDTLVISNDLTVIAVIDNVSDIAGTVAGDVELDGETFSFEASIAGAFGGDNAETALGTTMGLVTNPDDSVDSISGYFLADKQ